MQLWAWRKNEIHHRSNLQIPVSLASKLVDAIDVGAEGLDEADHQQLMKLANEISEALDNTG